MIYPLGILSNIKKKNIFVSVLLFFIVIIIFQKLNFNSKYLITIFIALLFSYIYLSYVKYNNNKKNDINDGLIKEIPILNKINNYKNLFKIYYDSKTLLKYNNYSYFKKSILYLEKFITIYGQIKINNDIIKYNYDIMINLYKKIIDSFKYMNFNLTNKYLVELHNIQLNKLDDEIKKYINEIISLNNNDIKNNGYLNYKKHIYENELLPYNNDFIIVNYL